ncbi:unnamed protein product [Rotaria sp. Silwood2]|nr:unnamed protein product [Rotaria sp. Silwood2]
MFSGPAFLRRILAHPDRHKYVLSSLQYVGVGSTPVHSDFLRMLEAELRIGRIGQEYGLTESGTFLSSTLYVDYDDDRRHTSIGRCVPHIELKIASNDGTTLPIGSEGEIWARGYSVMRGYYNDPEQTADAITNNGWLRTGDLANPKKLKNEQCKLAFQVQLHCRPQLQQQQTSSSTTIDDKYNAFVDYVHQASKTTFELDRTNKKQKDWLTDEILDVVDKKSKAFLKWQNSRGTYLETRCRNSYRRLRNLTKKKIDARQLEYWDEISLEIENAIKQHDPSTAYAMIRRLRGGKAKTENLPILDKHGELLTNSKQSLTRWKEYFNDLLNVPSHVDPITIQQIHAVTITTTEQRRQEQTPSLEEVQRAIKQMKNGKAPGNDGISADLIKAGGLPMAKWLHEIFVDIWENETIIEDWSTAILIRLYKNKGDKKVILFLENIEPVKDFNDLTIMKHSTSSSISFDVLSPSSSTALDCSSSSSSSNQAINTDICVVSDNIVNYTTESVTLCLKYKKQQYKIT